MLATALGALHRYPNIYYSTDEVSGRERTAGLRLALRRLPCNHSSWLLSEIWIWGVFTPAAKSDFLWLLELTFFLRSGCTHGTCCILNQPGSKQYFGTNTGRINVLCDSTRKDLREPGVPFVQSLLPVTLLLDFILWNFTVLSHHPGGALGSTSA